MPIPLAVPSSSRLAGIVAGVPGWPPSWLRGATRNRRGPSRARNDRRRAAHRGRGATLLCYLYSCIIVLYNIIPSYRPSSLEDSAPGAAGRPAPGAPARGAARPPRRRGRRTRMRCSSGEIGYTNSVPCISEIHSESVTRFISCMISRIHSGSTRPRTGPIARVGSVALRGPPRDFSQRAGDVSSLSYLACILMHTDHVLLHCSGILISCVFQILFGSSKLVLTHIPVL